VNEAEHLRLKIDRLFQVAIGRKSKINEEGVYSIAGSYRLFLVREGHVEV